ncbi:conserved hypothetical protein [Leishmania major strain Friedlin]|uniref:Uncharacterized protein n=1 Tax=Leishmania major TaxID=5664 RepID=E9AD72_LEIMA|nr:conserved hypothetical protein [Leishmania major strain Friedlin]CAG9576697.1 hypothetical_protein_-_conserved [Leishmania major strain Friedlin]CBZ12157.1 conserved hypothetical protein [Leishmania major strain Friedlin]|eukprot:XP_003721901.1 conserved hypothetical protein [Leishmania major strain Friedlin]
MDISRSSQHSATKESATDSSFVETQRAGSSLYIGPEMVPEEANRRSAHPNKSMKTSREQLLYLQALYPYAHYDELMAVISSTDSADEAAERAYEALNPDYNGFAYLKEQHDLFTSEKLRSAERATAFAGLKESLEERAASAFRPGHFGNLSQLQEYHDTVGLFIVDTSDWDRATLLPSRDLAEMAFMDLPLLEERTSYEAARATINGDSNDVNGLRRESWSQVCSPSLTASNNATCFLDLQPSRKLCPVSTTAPASLSGGKVGKCYREPSRDASEEQLTGGHNGSRAVGVGGDSAAASVVYVQRNDPPRAAPIIAWAPEAIRVGPAEARRECEGILRVFDEATFFKEPLLRSATPPPAPTGALLHAHVSPQESALAAPPSPQATLPSFMGEESEAHEPFDSGSGAVPNCGGGDKVHDANAEELLSAQAPSASHSHHRRRTCLPKPYADTQSGPTASTSTAYGTPNGTREISGDNDSAAFSNALSAQCRMRDAACKALKRRKPHPLTTSETVRQRIRSRTPVGNLIFRATSQHTPVLSPKQQESSNGRPNVVCSPGLALPRAAARDEASVLNGTAQSTERQQAAHHSCEDIPVDGSDAADGGAGAPHGERPLSTGMLAIPAAHSGCSSLDPVTFLNAEEERWEAIAMMLAPYEEVFGSKSRCALTRCIHDECPKLRDNATVILQRLLHVVGKALCGKEIVEGMTEEPLEVPLLGPILLSTSPIKLTELRFREDKCSIEFCEDGTQLQAKLNVKAMSLDAIQFAYIGEADAARQARTARQSQRRIPGSYWRAAARTQHGSEQDQYTTGVTHGTATIKAANVRVKGKVCIWLMTSGKMHVVFQKTSVSVGSFRLSTTVRKLNVLCTLGAPILRLMVQRGIKQALQSGHSL